MTPADIQKIATELLDHLGVNLTAEIAQDDEVFLVNLVGSDARLFDNATDNRTGALIVILKLLLKQKLEYEPKLIIDFNGQRAEKIHNVVVMAKKKAETVRVSGEEEEMPPMTPGERRAVHKELEGIAGVKTVSRGVEPHRRIVIQPSD